MNNKLAPPAPNASTVLSSITSRCQRQGCKQFFSGLKKSRSIKLYLQQFRSFSISQMNRLCGTVSKAFIKSK